MSRRSDPPEVDELRSPSRMRTLGEGLSPLWGGALLAAWPSLLREPHGSGTVLVLPGLGASDGSTVALRRLLARLGHEVHGWKIGRNHGAVPELLPAVREQVDELSDQAGEPIALVGQSLGGYLAREVAREHPDLVRRVVTLGSPVVGGPRYSSLAPIYAARGADFEAIDEAIERRAQMSLRVPITVIWSKRDGVVAWQACIDRTTDPSLVEHVEVGSTHMAMGFDPEVLRVVARRLSDDAGATSG